MLIKRNENTRYSSIKKIIALLLTLIILIIAVMLMPEAKAYAENSGAPILTGVMSGAHSLKTDKIIR